MTSPADIETADRLSRRRARIIPFLAIIFLAGQAAYFSQDRADLGSLSVPSTLPETVQADLRARGHLVTVSRSGVGGVALIGIDLKTKQATAVGPAARKID